MDEKNSDPGSRINISYHYFRELSISFWVKITKILCQFNVANPDTGWKNPDPG
jgi:hypothetical protein